MAFYYRMGVWHREDEETVGERRLKFFYSFYFIIFPILTAGGMISNDNKDQVIFSGEILVLCIVLLVKLWYIIWREKELLELLLNGICEYFIDDHKKYTQVTNKLNMLMKFAAVFLCLACFCVICMIVVPIFENDNNLFVILAFPLDWRNNEFAYWSANIFLCTQLIGDVITWSFTVITWYLMANCSLRYDVLGQQIRNMGTIKSVHEMSDERKMSHAERDNLYLRDLLEAIATHTKLKEYKY